VPKPVYFDSSVFLAIFAGDGPSYNEIRALLKELKKSKTPVYTSIITIQEVSVACYAPGEVANDNHARVHKLAKIEGISKEAALTAAKIEAQILDSYSNKQEKSSDNKRRKWDCFHIATAQCLKCSTLYSLDQELLKRRDLLKIRTIEFSEPTALNLPLDLLLGSQIDEPKQAPKTDPPNLQRSSDGSAQGQAATEGEREKAFKETEHPQRAFNVEE